MLHLEFALDFCSSGFSLGCWCVWETLWSASHISAEQKAELSLPGLHCNAILGWEEALPH